MNKEAKKQYMDTLRKEYFKTSKKGKTTIFQSFLSPIELGSMAVLPNRFCTLAQNNLQKEALSK
jgi:hypothetical protein